MKILVKALSILIILLIPFLLILSAGRIIWSPFFLEYEYNLPNFPPDEFGFKTADRLKWGAILINYTINNESDNFLSTLKFPDGSPLYNERELSHMLDVRLVVKAALKVWYALVSFTLLLGIAAWLTRRAKVFWKAISYGGWLTIGLIVAIIIAMLIDFNTFFAVFHSLFFKANTWIFYTSDTLIRLLPEKLWSDGFIFTGIITLVSALVCAFVGGRLSQKE